MSRIQRSALVMFSAEQMYHLVNDVAAYPQFLPGCVGSEVLSLHGAEMVARVDVAKAGIHHGFTTRNQLQPGRVISMTLVEGPFRHLQGTWTFTPLDDDASKVELALEFEFSSRLVELAFGRIFTELVQMMVQAFTLRAKEVYGE
ncbi:SRPBCC family protein [Pseudaeromonas sharmana]|uniref:SRPBCC family protein n=1 Tax=Pseudaeromonas sharmana TaxID=328412 RepID=A0ABV8CS94_9GAMM